jgi:WD40 repeat protein
MKIQDTKKSGMAETTVILFGTYEGAVAGLEASIDEKGTLSVEQIMSTPCHVGCVRSAAGCGRFAVTGGTDELINVFDVQKRTHLGTMGGSVHTSTVTALAVAPSGGILVSGCEEGQIAITRLKDSQTLKSYKGHKSAILDISCHPSGKMALSISTDNTLRMWDLTRGTCAAVRTVCPARRPNVVRGPVSAANMQVKYTPDGSRYALLLPGGTVEVCSSSSAESVVYDGPSTTVCPITENVILVGDSKGTLRALMVDNNDLKTVAELTTSHSSRIKGIARLDSNHASSVCAEGRIVFFRFDGKNKLEEIRSVDTGSRITCFSSNR